MIPRWLTAGAGGTVRLLMPTAFAHRRTDEFLERQRQQAKDARRAARKGGRK